MATKPSQTGRTFFGRLISKLTGVFREPAMVQRAYVALFTGLASDNPEIRAHAAGVLTGRGGEEIISELTDLLAHREPRYRAFIARALGGTGSPAAVPPLSNALRDKKEEVRGAATIALGNIGVAAIPVLLDALRKKDSDVPGYALQALSKIGHAAIPALSEVLREKKDPHVRASVACALGQISTDAIKPEARIAMMAALEDATTDQDALVQQEARAAIRKILANGGEFADTATNKASSDNGSSMPKEKKHAASTQEELAAEYQPAHKKAMKDREAFLQEANEYLAPRFWAMIQERLQENPPLDPDAKDQLAQELNVELNQLGIGVVCPRTGLVAFFRTTKSGEFHLIPFGHKNPSVNATDVPEFFSKLTRQKPLQFALAVTTKAARGTSGPSSSALGL